MDSSLDARLKVQFGTVAERLLRPSRARLAEARARIEGITDPREAWEALATHGLIPHAWVSEPGRRFVVRCDACGAVTEPSRYSGGRDYARCPACVGWSFAPREHPASVQHATLFASDTAGVLTAEALAREVARRLGRPREVIRWRVERRDWWYSPLGWHRDADFAKSRKLTKRRGGMAASSAARMNEALRRVEGLSESARAHLRNTAYLAALADVLGHANPFETALELFATGYAFDVVSRDAIELTAPAA